MGLPLDLLGADIPERPCSQESATTFCSQRLNMKEFVHNISESGNPKDPFSYGVYQHSKVLSIVGWIVV